MAITKLSNSGIATGGVLKYDSMLAGNAAYIPTDFESIATTTLSTTTASVTFSSIPATYSHLQIRGIVKVDKSNGNGDLQIRFNSDTGSNYAYHRLLGNGTSAVADGAGTTNGFIAYPVGDYTNANNVFTGFVCDILDYANANKYKTVRTLSGMDQNGLTAPNGDVGRVMLVSALWQNTNAITSIQLIDPSNSLRPYSSFALYGIKGA